MVTCCGGPRAPLLIPWSHAHGRWDYYKKVMAGKSNITTIKGNALIVSQDKQKILKNKNKNKRAKH